MACNLLFMESSSSLRLHLYLEQMERDIAVKKETSVIKDRGKTVSPIISAHKFSGIDMLFLLYETRFEAIASLLPPPLEPLNPPIVTINSWLPDRGQSHSPFTGCAVFIPCKYQEWTGVYCVHAIINTGWDILLGKDVSVASNISSKTIHLRKGASVGVTATRQGNEYITISGELTEQANIIDMARSLNLFFFHHAGMDPTGNLQSDPVLMRTEFKVRYNFLEQGHGEIRFLVSGDDPLGVLECLAPVAFFYGGVDISYGSEPITTVPADVFLSYLSGKTGDGSVIEGKIL